MKSTRNRILGAMLAACLTLVACEKKEAPKAIFGPGEWNLNNGTLVTEAEVGKMGGVTAGTVTASKALVVDSNKRLDTLVIGTLKLGAGAGTALTTTAAQLNQVTDAFGTVNFNRATKVARVALAAVDSGGGVFSWANPEAAAVLVTRVILDVTTQTSGACTLDVGMTATNGTTSADNLIDGLSLATAGLFDNIEDQGTNGTSRQKVATGKWVTGSVASGASSGLVGYAYIHYINP